MTGARSTTTWRLGAAAAVLCVAATSCSSNASTPESSRRCAVVQAKELSDIVGTKVELMKAQKGSTVCRYTSKDSSAEVHLQVEGPVEAGLPKLLLTDPKRVPGVGNEAWIATRNTPLGTRLIARRKGAMLTVDLSALKLTGKERNAAATAIAKAGVPNLPSIPVKRAGGLRGDAACERYTTAKVAEALGGVPTVSPISPPGSCSMVVEDKNLTASVSVLLESGAGQAQLDALVAGVPTAAKTKVGQDPAYWVTSSAGPAAGGQLDVLTKGKVLQVAIIGEGFAKDEAQQLATTLAQTAVS